MFVKATKQQLAALVGGGGEEEFGLRELGLGFKWNKSRRMRRVQLSRTNCQGFSISVSRVVWVLSALAVLAHQNS